MLLILHVSIANKPKIIIAAIASRPYVQAAVAAGFDVVAIDAFADVDLQKLATVCYQLTWDDGELNSQQLFDVLDSLDLQQFTGFCYGAGFEKTPNILRQIDEQIKVLGNTAEVVEKCKAPSAFFGLCDTLNLPHPAVQYALPADATNWLQKDIGGSGGGHIKKLLNEPAKQESVQKEAIQKEAVQTDHVYYQKMQAGRTISCLFVANKQDVQILGFNEQWLDGGMLDSETFRYGGAVSHAQISEQAKTRLTAYITQLSQAIGLVGINSCDAICDGDDVMLLEVNPRLSATMDLYQHLPLMALHIASQHSSEVHVDHVNKDSTAHQVLYAECALTVKDGVIWPDWVYDIPQSNSRFSVGMPICTVMAEAETALYAKQLVNERAATIRRQLLN